MITKLNQENFDTFIQQDYVLVDFFATWCGPCKMMHPVLESVAESRSDVKIAKLDVDECEDLARRYGVMSIPTLILFKNGQKIAEKVGYVAEPLLVDWLRDNE